MQSGGIQNEKQQKEKEIKGKVRPKQRAFYFKE
jgi:hypothetical protein